MTRAYEVAIVISPEQSDAEIDRFLHTIRQIFGKYEGKIEAEDICGRRPTAYTLRGHNEGFYAFFQITMPADKVAALETDLKLNEQIIRHLITIQEDTGENTK